MTCDEECVRKIVKDELAQFKSQKSSTKGTKKKSNWNIFLADCTKKQPSGTPLGDRTRACSVEYKELKKNGALESFISKLSEKAAVDNENKNGDNGNGGKEQR